MLKQSIVQFNCNGIRGQYHQILQLINTHNPKFILLQELKLGFLDKIKIKGYNLVTNLKPGDDNHVLSVGILIKKGIAFKVITGLDHLCVIGIDTINVIPVSLFSFYDNSVRNELSLKNMEIIIKAGKHKSVIMGDFNVKDKLWDENIPSSEPSNARAKVLFDIINGTNLILSNQRSTTRISPVLAHKNSAIDISLIDADMVHIFIWSVIKESYGSDHLPTCLSVETSNLNNHIFRIYDYKTTKWDLFNDFCDLSTVNISNLSSDEADQAIEDCIIYGLENSTHFFEFPNNKKRSQPWWDDEINKLRKEKNKFLDIQIKTKSKESLIAMKKFNCLYKRKLKEKKIASWEKFVSECNDDIETRDLWLRIKKINKQNHDVKISCIKDENGVLVDDQKRICDIIADHYSAVSSSSKMGIGESKSFKALKEKVRLFGDFQDNFGSLNDDFTLDELVNVVGNTKNSAPGSDGIKYNVFKNMSIKNLSIILLLFNKVWNEGIRPVDWSKSIVIPIPKIANVVNSNDTRPINLIKARPKLLDKLINTRLIFALESQKLISSNQFGFRRCKQTLDSLMTLNNVIEDNIVGGHTHMISFDIQKAFDKIWPQAILLKLKEFKFGGKLFKYVENYLGVRSFQVRIGENLSKVVLADIGVPQGSPLSSTLFIIAFQHMMDIAEDDEFSSCLAYADDLLIYTNGTDNMSNTKNLQSLIKRLSRKGREVGLNFAVEKSKSMHVCRKTSCNQLPNKIYGKVITKVKKLKLLGITFQSNHTFTSHINLLVEKLNKDVALLKILANKRYGLNQDLMRKIILALSISKIRYCIEIYGRASDTDVKKVDTTLNKMRRLMLSSFVTTPTASLIIQSGIPSFQTLRLKSNLIFSVKRPELDYQKLRSERSHSTQVNKFLPDIGWSLDQIVKDELFLPPNHSVKNRVFRNIFKKRKDDLVPGFVLPEVLQFCSDNKIINCYYTDGSKINNKVGYGVVLNGVTIKSSRINDKSSVYSAEAMAILSAILHINENNSNSVSAIFTDSAGIIDQLLVNNKKKLEIINQIKFNMTPNIKIVWIPSHFGIPGNELADSVAKKAACFDEIDEVNLSTMDARRSIVNFISDKLQEDWNTNSENKLFLVRQSATYFPGGNMFSRKIEMIFNRLRSGHSFLTHSYIINREIVPECKFCYNPLTIEHIFTCMHQNSLSLFRKHGIVDWKSSLFGEEDKVIELIKDLDYFNQI